MSTLPLTPSEYSPPACVSQRDVYDMALRCHGLCGLLLAYTVNFGGNSKEIGHILSGIEMLEDALESMSNALDLNVVITNTEESYVRN